LNAHLDCFPCFLRQALEASRMATQDEGLQRTVLQRVSSVLAGLPRGLTPVDMGMEVHRTVQAISGSKDPYRLVKKRSNDEALSLYPRLRKAVDTSPDPLLTAAKLSAVGNTIDFGANPEFDLERSVQEGLTGKFETFDISGFQERLETVSKVLYIGDNAGEIVFDKILVEEIVRLGVGVTFAVRGAPIINDATEEDARYVGMHHLAEVVSSGVIAPGTVLSRCNQEFTELFHRSELILAKGQGNYEGLSQEKAPIFFLLKIKCPVVSHDMGLEVGDLVLRPQTGHEKNT